MGIFKKALHSKIDVFVKFESAINLEIRGHIKKKTWIPSIWVTWTICIRAENWWHISTQKPPNVGSSSAISEPIIAGLVSARGPPNPMKLGNQLQRPTQTG